MTSGDQFEDGVPTKGLLIKDALLNPWYPQVNSHGWAPKVDTNYHV